MSTPLFSKEDTAKVVSVLKASALKVSRETIVTKTGLPGTTLTPILRALQYHGEISSHERGKYFSYNVNWVPRKLGHNPRASAKKKAEQESENQAAKLTGKFEEKLTLLRKINNSVTIFGNNRILEDIIKDYEHLSQPNKAKK